MNDYTRRKEYERKSFWFGVVIVSLVNIIFLFIANIGG